jgi:transposase, IS30 family
MPSTYRRLCQEDRYTIHRLLQEGKTSSQIARALNFHPSTISKEIKRNSGGRGYRPKQAGQFAAERKARQRRSPKIVGIIAEEVELRLSDLHSPEQITGSMRKEGYDAPSHETIYRYIARDKRAGGTLYTHLRINSKRRYRRRVKGPRTKIPNRVDITQRPASVDARIYYGDWEVDLVEGKKGTGFILSIVERKSRFSLFEKLETKQASTVSGAIISRLRAYKVRSLTYDNGTEFSNHLEVSRCLNAKGYFCAPYHSWEKGLVENHNGLLRQYYPKGESFKEIDPNGLGWVEDEINTRPRKTLNFSCPADYIDRILAS